MKLYKLTKHGLLTAALLAITTILVQAQEGSVEILRQNAAPLQIYSANLQNFENNSILQFSVAAEKHNIDSIYLFLYAVTSAGKIRTAEGWEQKLDTTIKPQTYMVHTHIHLAPGERAVLGVRDIKSGDQIFTTSTAELSKALQVYLRNGIYTPPVQHR